MSRFRSSMILAVAFFSNIACLTSVGNADLVSYYSFDSVAAQESQTAKDAFGVQDGTVMGATTYVQGVTGDPDDWAVNLNFEGGTGSHTDFVQFDERDFGLTFTIAAWIVPLDVPPSTLPRPSQLSLTIPSCGMTWPWHSPALVAKAKRISTIGRPFV